MPTIPVNDTGTVLYYEDSGIPNSTQDYTTLIIIHGSLFHGKIFERLIPYATEHNIRLVLLNARDYPGSTPYSTQELQDMLSGSTAVQREFVRSLGRELVEFLVQYVQRNHVPHVHRKDTGQVKGGIVLIGWSLGNSVPISLLALASSLPEETKRMLEQYLRTVVLYDPSAASVGVTPAEGVYHPMRDTSLSPKERADIFLVWVSSYFPTIPSLEEVTPALLAARTPTPDEVRLPTVKGMTSNQLASCTHFDALTSNLAMRQVDTSVYAMNLWHALVDTGGIWADVKVLVLWCNMTMVDSIWGAKGILNVVHSGQSGQGVRRSVKFLRLEGANHFVHWDEPEKFMSVLAHAA